MSTRNRNGYGIARSLSKFCFALSATLITTAVLLTGCSDPIVSSESSQLQALSTSESSFTAAKAGFSTSDVYTFPPETATLVEGAAARLIRTKNGVNYRFSTNSLMAGHAYTLWVVIFNEPEECIDGCDGSDLFTPDALPDMLYGAGVIVGGSGTATLAGRTKVGDASGSVQAPLGLAPNGLMDPYGAEIHLVVHDHGEKIPEYMPSMIHTIAGGCTNAGIPDAETASPWNNYDGPEYGVSGPNTCGSVQFAVHMP